MSSLRSKVTGRVRTQAKIVLGEKFLCVFKAALRAAVRARPGHGALPLRPRRRPRPARTGPWAA
jgi:hypothetical protein